MINKSLNKKRRILTQKHKDNIAKALKGKQKSKKHIENVSFAIKKIWGDKDSKYHSENYKHKIKKNLDNVRPQKKGIYAKCKNCENQFYLQPSGKRIFCSRKCQYEYRSKINRKKTQCLGCVKIFEQSKKSNKKYCTKTCFLKNNNPMKQSNSVNKMKETKKLKYPDGNGMKHTEEFKKNSRERMLNGGAIKARKANANRITSIEKKMINILHELNISYAYDKIIFNHAVDFYIEKYNLIIECDGDYWHNQPNVKEKDQYFTNIYLDNGFNILRFKGSEINTDIIMIKEKILEVIKNKMVVD